LNANGFEMKQRVQRGVAFFDLTIIFVIAAKKLNLIAQILVKNTRFTL